jgi:hypothetical protein
MPSLPTEWRELATIDARDVGAVVMTCTCGYTQSAHVDGPCTLVECPVRPSSARDARARRHAVLSGLALSQPFAWCGM